MGEESSDAQSWAMSAAGERALSAFRASVSLVGPICGFRLRRVASELLLGCAPVDEPRSFHDFVDDFGGLI